MYVVIGVPHTAEEDVLLDGFHIPKGATVFGNAWAILHDPERYPSPATFNPDRHLSPDGRVLEDPVLEYAFGFGTRKCPGRHFADSTMWLYIVTVLAVCDIRHAKDKEGREVKVEGKLFEERSLVQ
jgi:cytochrome P450